MTMNELEALSDANIDLCCVKDLVDIQDVTVDKSIPVNERVEKYIDKVKNPYLFRVGDVVVKTNFNPKGKNFSKAIEDVIISN